MQIDESTFLVTGGASGLGAATVRRLVAGGGRVVIADVNGSAANELADELGDAVRAVVADITDPADVAKAIAVATDEFGHLAGTVNCAGVGVAMRVVGRQGPHELATFRRVVEINLVGTFNVVRLTAAAMSQGAADEEGERGVIVNTASVAAFEGQIGQAAYSASKAGIAGMTLPVARELARLGIRVVTVAPGLFETPLLAGLSEAARQSLESQVVFPQRLGQPSEFAALVVHAIENRMLNGCVVRLDGAIRMAAK